METVTITKIERTETDTLITKVVSDDTKPDWGDIIPETLEGVLTDEQVLEFVKNTTDEGINVILDLGENKLEEKIEESVKEPEAQPKIPSGSVAPEVKTYLGKKIISESTSTINEKEYITLRLEDGSVCQLSEAEYKELVK